MADISKLVNYEHLHRLELFHPATDEPTGVVFMLRSSECDEVKKVQRRHLDETFDKRMSGRTPRGTDVIKREFEKAAASIASWDWGDNTWQGEVPKLTPEKAAEVLDQEPWIFHQVTEAANKLANFTQD